MKIIESLTWLAIGIMLGLMLAGIILQQTGGGS